MNKKGTRLCALSTCKKRFKALSNHHYFCSSICVTAKGDENAEKVKAKLKKTEWTKEKAELKIDTHSKENRSGLQREINKLARQIDARFGYGCVDCCGRPYGKQIDGAHFHSVGSNSSLRYNLHNIHSADSQCNQYSNTHISGYKIGLEKRYGKEYLEMVEHLPALHKELRLSNLEISNKLKLVRSLNRNFKIYQLQDGDAARDLFNTLIGIYPPKSKY